MKKFWNANKFVLIAFVLWLLLLQFVEWGSVYIPTRPGYFGPIPWANFDGIHYLRIAQTGYFQYSEAFFPFYPLSIRFLHYITGISYEYVGVGISLVSFLVGLVLLYRLLETKSKVVARWTIVFLLTFPTSFFFRSVYTEGLFFLCFVLTMYFTQKKQFFLAGIAVSIAGATRVIGICLVVYVVMEYIRTRTNKLRLVDTVGCISMPLGLFGYMMYLWKVHNDPFLFFHVQSAFGANRSGSAIILLPQVVWRYLKIIYTAYLQPTVASYIVTLFEFIFTGASYVLLLIGRRLIPVSLMIYCLLVITIPTLTGTFSSMPRYVMAAVPLFIVLGSIRSLTTKCILLIVSLILEIMATMLFLRGWFIA